MLPEAVIALHCHSVDFESSERLNDLSFIETSFLEFSNLLLELLITLIYNQVSYATIFPTIFILRHIYNMQITPSARH